MDGTGVADGIRTTEGWVPNEATQRIMARVRVEEFLTDIDWDEAFRRFGSPELPAYVRSSIHGVEGGFSNPLHAASWDAIVKEIFAEYLGDERAYRDLLPALVEGHPGRILDVACGTGESTLAWRRRFPEAEVVAADVSPHMLAVAERKLAGDVRIELRWANAEALPFEDASFDCVTASLLFHELPREISPVVLAEMRRVLRPRGAVAVMEPYSPTGRSLHPIPFPEPYLKDYLETDWDEAFRAAGFTDVRLFQRAEGWARTARRAA